MITTPARLLAAAFSLLAASGPVLSTAVRAAEGAPLFTEDFESGSLSPSVWDQRVNGAASLTVQQAQVAHGKSALQVHYAAGAARAFAFIVASHLPDALRQHCFGRAYVYISPKMPAGHDVLVTAGTPGFPLSNFLEIGVSGGKNVNLSYQQNDPKTPPRQETMERGGPYPVGRWFCLEWEFSDQPDKTTVWIDGELAHEASFVLSFNPKEDPLKKVPPSEGKSSDLVKNFTEFAFGFRYWGTSRNDFDLYYDDLALGTQRIGPIAP